MENKYIFLISVVYILWIFGKTLSCDQCVNICGTQQFPCCFNNMKKKQFGFRIKSQDEIAPIHNIVVSEYQYTILNILIIEYIFCYLY